jgi:hypothetical protein
VHTTIHFGATIAAVKVIFEMLSASLRLVSEQHEIPQQRWTTGNLFFKLCADTLSP